jgi:hypothetical protein
MTVISPQDLNLVALGVVIWVVALSVAFSFYIPVLRAERAHGARDGRNPNPGQRNDEDAPPSALSAGGPA